MAEPVSLDSAKQHLRVFDTSEHELIEGYITAARQWVENHTGHILFQRTITEEFQAWGTYLRLFKRPIISIDTIEYDSADDDQVEFEDFEYSLGQYPMLIYPSISWPGLRTNGYITLTYTAGYADGECPPALVQAVRLMAGHFYTTRSGVGPDKLEEAPLAVRSLCSAYRVPVIA